MKYLFLCLLMMSGLASAETFDEWLERSLPEFVEPSLIGGQAVTEQDFPSVVYITIQGARCTATIIGPETLLTAGHCVEFDEFGAVRHVLVDGQTVTFTQGGQANSALCEASPNYPQIDHDIALCKITNRIDGIKYGVVASQGPALREIVTLMGFGCVRRGGGGGNDGTLRVGLAPVVRLSREAQQDFDFITQGNTALCFGDSGGPVMKRVTNPRNQDHIVLGVNSKGDIRTTSLLADLNTNASKAFIQDFIQANNVEICGVNAECGSGAEPIPPTNCDLERAQLQNAFNTFLQCMNRR